MSFFKTAAPVIAVVNQERPTKQDASDWVICLDDIKDPGNLGTIIRIADWYGINQIYASKETVDLYNPKTISSTMGSFTRVDVDYVDLGKFFEGNTKPVFFTLMAGDSIYDVKKQTQGVVVIGSEANGISESLMSIDHHSITIPKSGGAESLNAAVATAIVCDRLLR